MAISFHWSHGKSRTLYVAALLSVIYLFVFGPQGISSTSTDRALPVTQPTRPSPGVVIAHAAGNAAAGLSSSVAQIKDKYWPGSLVSSAPKALPSYSIKPLVYVFPQFHPIPQNDEFWGENFTEWTNVRKVTTNTYGIDIKKPAEAIHGIVYHHYWFGYPVMDGVLKAMLDDGHPEIPFMLSWANEPWTKRWDGVDKANGDGTLIAQHYKDVAGWKEHFDWMAPYFRHKNYIRVNGKVQMVIYNPSHIGDLGKKMFSAWRLWAAQDPTIGGMDVIETALGGDNPDSRGPTDAKNEFGLRSGGEYDATVWPHLPRTHKIYHRGALVAWDNYPRHPAGGIRWAALALGHPKLWKWSMIEMFARIKSDPNPLGEENFLFINAWNEWGEGNAMEPSIQDGNGYIAALDDAMEYANKHIPWTPHELLESLEIAKEVNSTQSSVDVCVIIREYKPSWPWQELLSLRSTLRSLRAMNNKSWRAVVAPMLAEPGDWWRMIDMALTDAHEPRAVRAEIPEGMRKKADEHADGADVVDWVMKNLKSISPSCSTAKYLLISNSTHQYERDSFDHLNKTKADIVGINFESRGSMSRNDKESPTWDERCKRFEGYFPCTGMTADSKLVDLGALFFNMARWQSEGISLARYTESDGHTNILKELAYKPSPWTYTMSELKSDEGQACEDVRLDQESGTAFLACGYPTTRKAFYPAILNVDKTSAPTYREYFLKHHLDSNTTTQLNVIGWEGDLVLHGIDLVTNPINPQSLTLWAVNHDRRHESILKFAHILGSNDLVFEKEYVHALIKTPNAVAASGPESFFISNDHYTYPAAHLFSWYFRVAEALLGPFKWASGIVHCDAASGTLECKDVSPAGQHPAANGVLLVDGGRTLAVNEIVKGTTTIYDVDPTSKMLKVRDEIYLARRPTTCLRSLARAIWLCVFSHLHINFVMHCRRDKSSTPRSTPKPPSCAFEKIQPRNNSVGLRKFCIGMMGA
ncbi:uncharacterized protein AB675_7155 [Cyphellophora attinorum]|uniref:Uncharacterized protein n=1 Tax=Cyphellophora attinorum TaxID=1664694 RepID=A0A0N1P1C4_9EURO|nr:uncharacterized protein AB675_7155 [Phialophora attinorum]KPI43594.1 hypothetical protein AB675_7155 [Phialophora attinorum]